MFITTNHHDHDHHSQKKHDHGDHELQIQQNNNKYSLSKESSSSSSLLYYGGKPGSIPFLWESCPGTPKSKFSNHDSLIPPLTPPPSYYSSHYNKKTTTTTSTSTKIKRSRSNLILDTLLPKKIMNLNKTRLYSANSSIWSLESSSSVNNPFHHGGRIMISTSTPSRFSSSSSSFDSGGDEDYDDQVSGTTNACDNSPTSTLCLGFGRAIRRGCLCYRS
ncbi:hypothetical protein PanWU01x14_361650 [Parasponia andersonii]|uniref:Uncharacterized protein n=1 Tax=Parasponia andersonii TaxID=3476 RepID=A0A2P5A7A2_PARAD|nr:hypothetical protein PanWU01x14_361650 [Parasponia andersonii]